MNKDINLTELIEREKEAFLSSFENEEHLIGFLEKQKENKRLEISKQKAKERYAERENFFTEAIINIKQEVNL